MIRRLARKFLERRGRAELARRCTFGGGTVVYSPHLVTTADGRADQIVIGSNSHIRGELFAFPGSSLKIGDYCYVGENSRIWSFHRVSIGNRVLIAHNVTVVDSLTHPMDPQLRHEHFRRIITSGHPREVDLGSRPVVIDDDAWIACNAVVLRGVRLGQGSVVAAGSVVTRDVEPLTLVAGNPARFVRRIEPTSRGSTEYDTPVSTAEHEEEP